MLQPAPFPANRPRRLRQAPWIRSMVAENVLSPGDFIWPCFVIDGEDRAEPIASWCIRRSRTSTVCQSCGARTRR